MTLFILDPSPVVHDWPVDIRLPTNGGALRTVRIFSDVRVLPEDAYEELIKRSAGLRDTPATASQLARGEVEILRSVLVAVRGLADQDGAEIGIEPLADVLCTSPFAVPVIRALWEAVFAVRYGLDKSGGATEKNLQPSPASGPNAPLVSATANTI